MQLRGLALRCLVALPLLQIQIALARVVAKSTSGDAKSVRSARNGAASSWFPMDLGLGSSGDLSAFGASESADTMIVPGEGVIQDEMLAPQPVTHPHNADAAWKAAHKRQRQSLLTMSKFPHAATHAQMPVGASRVYQHPDVHPRYAPLRPMEKASAGARAAAAESVEDVQAQKVVKEYDVDPDEGNDDYRTVPMVEAQTKEEVDRARRGDVEHVKPEELKKPKKIRIRRQQLATIAEQQQVDVKHTDAEATEQMPGNSKMMSQCMSFANWVKSQGSTGPDFVRMWKGTCTPGVMSGAPGNYVNMCNSLGTAVSKYSTNHAWNPGEVCQAVMEVFQASGVGATPL